MREKFLYIREIIIGLGIMDGVVDLKKKWCLGGILKMILEIRKIEKEKWGRNNEKKGKEMRNIRRNRKK